MVAWGVVPLAVLGAIATPVADPGPTDPLGCESTLFDPEGVLDRPRVEREIELVASSLGADVRVRVERSLDAGLDARMAQLEQQCAGWEVAGDRAPDLVVVMYSSQEREAAIYYGADQGPRLESRWEPAVDAMIVHFRRGRFTDGVIDGLALLWSSSSPTFLPATGGDDDRSSAGSGASTAILWLVLLLVVVAAVNVWRYLTTGEWGERGSSSGWGWSSRRRHRYRSFGGFGGSRGSSRSRSRGSGGSRRSGGGSKRW